MTLMDRKDDRPEIVVRLIDESALLSNPDPTDQHIYEVPGRLWAWAHSQTTRIAIM
jgi:hypothetical protein